MRIILADPDKMSGKVLEIMLLEAEHQVIHTGTAAEAIREVIGQETDAVLIDTDLPDMDGFNLCKELRARRYNGPILLVSESRSARDEMRSFMFGADDFMAKLFHPGVLIARLDAITRRYKRTDHQALGTILKVGNAQLSIGELTFQIDGQPSVTLTPTEMTQADADAPEAGFYVFTDHPDTAVTARDQAFGSRSRRSLTNYQPRLAPGGWRT
jgi:two-component system, OmpR family, response regulator RegX3